MFIFVCVLTISGNLKFNVYDYSSCSSIFTGLRIVWSYYTLCVFMLTFLTFSYTISVFVSHARPISSSLLYSRQLITGGIPLNSGNYLLISHCRVTVSSPMQSVRDRFFSAYSIPPLLLYNFTIVPQSLACLSQI